MATVHAINTNFTATTANLEKGTKRAEKIVQGFGGKVNSLASSALPNIGKIIAGAAIGITVKRVVDRIKSELDEISDIGDQATNLGIGATNLQQLQFGAEMAGVSAEQLTEAMGRMSKGFADAGEMSLTPEQQLRLVADAIAAIENPTQRVQTVMDIFGRSGLKMIAMLEGGSAGLDEAAARASELGANLTEMDMALAKLASDGLAQVSFAFDNLWKQGAVELAPAITVLAESLGTLIGSFAQGADQSYGLSRSILTFVGNTVDGVNNIRAVFLEVIAAVADGLGRLQDLIEETLHLDSERSGLRDFADELSKQAQAMSKFEWDRELIRRMDEAMKRAGEAVKKTQERSAATALVREFEPRQVAQREAAKVKDISPAAVERGTAAAIEAINKGGAASSAKKQLHIAEKMLAEEQKGNRLIEQLVRQGRNGGLQPANLGGS